MLSAWWAGLSKELHERWIQSWQSTVLGLALAAGIMVVDYTTSWLQTVQGPWVPVAAMLVALVGGMLKSASVKAAGKAAVVAILVLSATPALAGPTVSSRSGKLSLAVNGPDLTIHPLIGVAPLAGYNFETQQAVFAPSLMSSVEFDIKGWGGPTVGGSFSVGQTGIPNITLAGGLSIHPAELADLSGGAVTHIVVQYQQSVVGTPFVRQIVFGPALAF